MAVSSVHPLFSQHLLDWQQMRDTYEGERAVKSKDTIYLPATQGMIQDGMSQFSGVTNAFTQSGGQVLTPVQNPQSLGYQAYQAYKSRAVFHDLVRYAVEYFIGLMHSKPPVIELPEKMMPMLTDVTNHHESMEQLLRRINEEQLVSGRVGILADFPSAPVLGQVLPQLFLYKAESIRNWDEGTVEQDMRVLNLVVLDESENVRAANTFEWRFINKFRVLNLGTLGADEAFGQYTAAIVEGLEANFTEADLVAPSIQGRTLTKIPFVFCNSKDVSPVPDRSPLLGLSNLALAIYRGEADYRQNLFMQGQDTLVIISGDEQDQHRTGAGATLNIKKGGDAKYIGVSSTGLPEQRQALENDLRKAENEAGKVIDTRSRQKESGNALNTRLAAQTANLHQIAKTGASALEKVLKIVAEWLGANPDQVTVTPNLEFQDQPFTGQDALFLTQAKSMGFPLSQESLHEIASDKGLTQMSFEEEMAAIEGESPLLNGTGLPGMDPNDPGDGGKSDPNDPNEGKPGESGGDNGGKSGANKRGNTGKPG